MDLRVFANSEAATNFVLETLKNQLASKPNSNLALPAGETPREFYRNMKLAKNKKELDLTKCHFFQLDEVLCTDGFNFHKFFEDEFIKPCEISDSRFLTPRDPLTYEMEIRKAGGIDWAFLGIGLNGHVAFNEPGSAINSSTRLVDLEETTRKSLAKYYDNQMDHVPCEGITMGLGTLFESRQIVLLALGSGKAEVIKKLMQSNVDPKFPASFIKSHPNSILVLDQAAAKDI